MDIIQEINKLPTLCYLFEKNEKSCYALLGGQSCKKVSEIVYWRSIIDVNLEMQKIYEKENLIEADKTRLARLMKQMVNLCEGRLEQYYTLKQQEEYLQTLSQNALVDIELQVQMYKDAREYYKEFLF